MVRLPSDPPHKVDPQSGGGPRSPFPRCGAEGGRLDFKKVVLFLSELNTTKVSLSELE